LQDSTRKQILQSSYLRVAKRFKGRLKKKPPENSSESRSVEGDSLRRNSLFGSPYEMGTVKT